MLSEPSLDIFIKVTRCQSLSFARTRQQFHGYFLPASLGHLAVARWKTRAFDATLLQHRSCCTLKTESKTCIAVFLVVKLDAVFCVIIILSWLVRGWCLIKPLHSLHVICRFNKHINLSGSAVPCTQLSTSRSFRPKKPKKHQQIQSDVSSCSASLDLGVKHLHGQESATSHQTFRP